MTQTIPLFVYCVNEELKDQLYDHNGEKTFFVLSVIKGMHIKLHLRNTWAAIEKKSLHITVVNVIIYVKT